MRLVRFRGAADVAEAARVPAVVFASCPLCGESRHRLVYDHPECGKIVDCTGCGLRYTKSRARHSWAELRHAEPAPLPEVILQKEVDQTADYDAIVRALGELGAAGRLLELGCMTGHFLERAKEAGFAVTGLDPDVWATRYAVEHFGVDARPQFLDQAGFAEDSFDVVAMFHTMEHLTQPVETLREIHRVLRPGGLLAVEIPIIDAAAVRLLGPYHRHYVYDHTLFMTRRTAKELLASGGFQVVRTDVTGRHIRLGRLADVLGRVVPLAERPFRRGLQALRLEARRVHLNARDVVRLYAVPLQPPPGAAPARSKGSADGQ
ncbi:MAG TPA: methyltransferase domain-containing protein [Acidimicrobiales bacterium]|nr:methyltransferase domain-containing protein [Acidimicrobiales bacterium]